MTLSRLNLEPRNLPALGGFRWNPYIKCDKSMEDFDNYVAAAVRPIKALPPRDFGISLSGCTSRVARLDDGRGGRYWGSVDPRPAGWTSAMRENMLYWELSGRLASN